MQMMTYQSLKKKRSHYLQEDMGRMDTGMNKKSQEKNQSWHRIRFKKILLGIKIQKAMRMFSGISDH